MARTGPFGEEQRGLGAGERGEGSSMVIVPVVPGLFGS